MGHCAAWPRICLASSEPGGQIDNRAHMAETSCMRSISFAFVIICKGSLQTG